MQLLSQLCTQLAGKYGTVEDGPGRFNYRYSRTFKTAGGDRAATILFGGSNGHPNVEASGAQAPALAEALRAGGVHRVTRCDVAVDLIGAGLYDHLRGLCQSIADANRIACREIVDRDPSKGNTVYLGSRKSTVFARAYEKGKADRSKIHPDDYHNLLCDWVRIELEVKPQKEMREQAALMHPEAFWGISPWTQQLATEALSMAPDPIPFHPRRTSSDERAWQTSIAQYRQVAQRRCETLHQGDRMALAMEWLDGIFPQSAEDAA